VLLRWVDEALELSRWEILEGEEVLGVFHCVAEVLGVSCWMAKVLGLSLWVIRGGKEAWGLSRGVEAAWAVFFWGEEAWGMVPRSLPCGVTEEVWVGTPERCRSKERYPLSPRSFAHCCPALWLPPLVSGERRGLR
jgi:hypothetical protein